ncbi:hypothetical protein HPB49_026061 [Dermacentor silvarum]|nr:hypothetical protein HPB49_026061 [Dermacentor silvarum]
MVGLSGGPLGTRNGRRFLEPVPLAFLLAVFELCISRPEYLRALSSFTDNIRYFAIVHPMCGRLSRWRSVAIIGALWGCSALLSLPPLLYSRTAPTGMPTGACAQCAS